MYSSSHFLYSSDTYFFFYRIRVYIHKVVASAYFDNVILALILISSGLLALEDATNADASINTVCMIIPKITDEGVKLIESPLETVMINYVLREIFILMTFRLSGLTKIV